MHFTPSSMRNYHQIMLVFNDEQETCGLFSYYYYAFHP